MATVAVEAPIERIAGVVEHAGYWDDCRELLHDAVGRNPRLRVGWLGHLDYPATDELLRLSDIVVVPGQWPEPLGAVAFEAMSAGAAVVASDIGGLDWRYRLPAVAVIGTSVTARAAPRRVFEDA